MRILGIDPGIACTGYAVLESGDDGKLFLIELGVIRTSPQSPMADRLKTVFDGICEVIASLQPKFFAIESVFVGKNVQSALKLGHARGAAMVAASKSGLDVVEFSPREVKQNITGNGNASKEQVQFMVTSILKLTKVPKPNDAADAVAIALSFLQTYKFKQIIKELR
ncbi:MAG: crossover junction endodeoxyribonuclease RuvC [Candidatus Delongbacteria bacterium]|nr:crossover junction endodeoxyribonuclease RuvC [Candidatus Delongbacteria bacterium]MCG2760243.1 crossover junction endodeoxyribonuclease RuvC [Candidatus Delongbacteria bacterium]